MCAIEFITLPSDVPFGVCQYLLARFVIFCFFAGVAMIVSVCDTEQRDYQCVVKLLILALGLELLGVVIALGYVALSVIILTELLCTVIILSCFCCVVPLANRAMRRRGIFVDHHCISTAIVAAACSEGWTICHDGIQHRVAPETANEVVAVTSQNFMKSGTVQVVAAARVGINIL